MTARDIDPSFVLTRVRLDTETSSQQFVVRHLVVALKLQEFQASVLETCQVLDLVPSSHFDAASINTYQSFQQTLRSCERFTVFLPVYVYIYIYTLFLYGLSRLSRPETGDELKTWVAERRVDMANVEHWTQTF